MSTEGIKKMAAGWTELHEAIDQSIGCASTLWDGPIEGEFHTDDAAQLSTSLQEFILSRLYPAPARSKGEKIVVECLQNNEPFFVFRAQDIFTPMVLKHYIKILEDYGPDDPDMHAGVVNFINLLKQWQTQNVAKVRYPD